MTTTPNPTAEQLISEARAAARDMRAALGADGEDPTRYRNHQILDACADALAAPLDPERVAEVAEAAGNQWQWKFDQFLSETGADPGALYLFIARALCEAYTEGKLT